MGILADVLDAIQSGDKDFTIKPHSEPCKQELLVEVREMKLVVNQNK